MGFKTPCGSARWSSLSGALSGAESLREIFLAACPARGIAGGHLPFCHALLVRLLDPSCRLNHWRNGFYTGQSAHFHAGDWLRPGNNLRTATRGRASSTAFRFEYGVRGHVLLARLAKVQPLAIERLPA